MLVVARDQKHLYAAVRDLQQRLQRALDQSRGQARPVQQVAAVHDEVDRAAPRRFQRLLEPPQKVQPAPGSRHPGPQRPVEADVGVRQQQDPDPARYSHLSLRRRAAPS